MAVQETVDITINSSQAIASLRNIENNLNTLTNGFKDFMIGVAEGMTSALRETTRASAGVDKMRKSFDGLNASVDKTNINAKFGAEVAKSSQAVSQLAGRVTQTGKQLLGLESIIGAFAITNLVRGANEYANATASSSISSMAAARATQSLTESTNNFYRALLETLRPINELIADVKVSEDTWKRFLTTIKDVIAVLLILAGFTIIGRVIKGIQLLIQTGRVLYTQWSSVKALMVGLGATFTQVIRGILRTPEGSAIFSKWIQAIDWLNKNLKIIAVSVIAIAATIKNFVLPDSFVAWFDKAIPRLKQFLGLSQQFTISGAEVPGRFSMGPEQEKAYEQALQNVANARLALTLEIEDSTQAYKRQNEVVAQNLRLENRLFGASNDMIEVERLRLQFQQQRIQAMDEFARRMRDLTPDQAAAGGRAMILAQQDAYMKLSKAAEATQITEIKGLQNKRAQLDAFNKQMEYTTELYNQQIQRTQTLAGILQGVRGDTAGVLFEREQLGRGPIQQQIAAAYEDARKAALAAQRQFAETFGDTDGLTPERMAELVAGLDAIAAAFKNLAFQTENNILISQQWSTGWKDAYETFVDNALNAADRAREVFNGMVSSMENALDNFVRTGKLNFRDLINSMIADLMSAALRQAFRNLLMATSGGGGGWLSSLGRFFAGFFANGGFIPPGKAGIVGERGPELVQGPAQVTPLTGMGAPINNYYTYNINALDAKSVAQLFSENRRTLLGVTEQARKEMPIRQRF